MGLIIYKSNVCVNVFFFKQKTAYEMRISDWSSDVCSSDLHAGIAAHLVVLLDLRTVVERHVPAAEVDHLRAEGAVGVVEDRLAGHGGLVGGREHHYPRAAQRHGEAASIRNGAADRTLAAEPFPHGSAAQIGRAHV